MIDKVSLKPGEFLFHENETSYHFFIIQEGEVEVFKSTDGDRTVLLAKVGPGHSLGEFAMLDKQPRSASARALTPVVAARLSAQAYEDLLEELPDWAVAVMRSLVERIRATNEIVRKFEVEAGLTKKSQQALESAIQSTEFTAKNDDDTITDTNFDFSIFDTEGDKERQ